MFHVLEQPQLPVGPLGEELRLERSVQLLDRHFGSCPGVHRRAEGENTPADQLGSGMFTISPNLRYPPPLLFSSSDGCIRRFRLHFVSEHNLSKLSMCYEVVL